MTDVIYDRAAVRESSIWNAFQYNGPFGPIHTEERTILFGLYANTYLHGRNYLREIEAEDLARLVDTYNNNMAKLTGEQAQNALNIAAKYHVERITDQIHAVDMGLRDQKIDSINADYDAKTEALAADEAAVVTQQAKVQLAWDKAAQKVKELEMRTELEAVNYAMVDVDIAEQELKAARADLAVIEAGLKGLDIQLAITQTGIDITNTQLDVTKVATREAGIDVDIAETDIAVSQIGIDVTETGIRESQIEIDGQKIQADTAGVATRVTEADVTKAQIEMDGEKIQSDTAGVGVRITEAEAGLSQVEMDGKKIQSDTVLVGVRQSEAEVQKAKAEIRGEQIQLDTVEVGVSISETELRSTQAEMDGEKIQLDTSKTYLDVSEAGVKVKELEAKLVQYDVDIAKVDADTARLKLVDSELTIAQADLSVKGIENEVLTKDVGLIKAQADNIQIETGFRDDQKGIQETLDGKTLEYDGSEHSFKMTMSQKETKFKDDITDKKVEILDNDKRALIDDTRIRKFQDAKDKADILDLRARAAELYAAAVVEAARDMATANIVNVLTHSIE